MAFQCRCGIQVVKNASKAARLVVGSSLRGVIASPLLSTQRNFSNTEHATRSPEDRYEDVAQLFSDVKLKVRGSDEAVLDSYTQFVQRAATTLNLDISGKIVIPMHIEKRTLLKSPHVYKTHRYQYELRTHARMLQLRQMTGNTADIFFEYIQRNLPEGVSMSVEATELESMPDYLTRAAMENSS
uniref:Small ribosomal subunit protein uS10m n=1 Tax=Clytia hemisphaerica TaxID=252671 RepID=A0A7M5WLQ7_9CNID